MRQLTASLLDAREGSGEVRGALLRAAFKPRLPGECVLCVFVFFRGRGGGEVCWLGLGLHGRCAWDRGARCRLSCNARPRRPPARPAPASLSGRSLTLALTGTPSTPPACSGLTKLVSKLSKEGAWRKALEVFEAVDEMG